MKVTSAKVTVNRHVGGDTRNKVTTCKIKKA
jgi:hypothetical protein